MAEPQTLTPETHRDAVDIDVTDMESITMTRKDLERMRGAEWAKARKTFAEKAEEKAARRHAMDLMADRLDKIEKLVELALGVLIPGLTETDTEKDE